MKDKTQASTKTLQDFLQKIIQIITNSKNEDKNNSNSINQKVSSLNSSEISFTDFDDLSFDFSYENLSSSKANYSQSKTLFIEFFYIQKPYKKLIEKWSFDYSNFDWIAFDY